MKLTTYPKQVITTIADTIHGEKPEAVIIDESNLAEEIVARLDGQDHLELITGDNDLFIFADIDIRWDEVDPPDMTVGYYGSSKPWITELVVQAFLPDEHDPEQIGEQIEVKINPWAVCDYVWDKY